MTKALLVFFALIITQISQAQEEACARTTSFGGVEICLKKVAGYKESYLTPVVKAHADATEVPANTVLGYYLNNTDYGSGKNIDVTVLDDYFKIYGTLAVKDYEANSDLLNQLQTMVADNFISKNWDEVSKDIDKLGLDVEIGKPVMIDSYNLNPDSFTLVLLIKYMPEGAEPYTRAMTMNGIIINNRLVWMAYYLMYEEPGTIEKLKANSDKILAQLMAPD